MAGQTQGLQRHRSNFSRQVTQGASVSELELRDWINSNVEARFQRVREVIRLKEFPRNAAGKTLKREIRESFSASPSNKPPHPRKDVPPK